ncbi:cation:proton antiporter regulatory subunit [Orrella marina]|uniref:RCK C-terminal domain-containing protein n=1 Tax=Orrella marina TaxID=2163011 RepID=A0A2R4XGB4_9BURK|nr:TrkA C-terminal domain-containing protein [Orrella marina]AWB32847.1 hypothetical protein DBV39_02940 [Orrella marina]
MRALYTSPCTRARPQTPRKSQDKNQILAESRVREQHQITVVGIKRPNQDFSYAKPDSAIQSGDLLIVAGSTRSIERFSGLVKLTRRPKRRQQGRL